MSRPTFTSVERFTLETPYGTVKVQFESLQKCVVLLPDQYTEPPTSYLTIDSVSVEGSLVFELWGRRWKFQGDDECSRRYDVATDCRISKELRHKLAKKLSSLLSQWVETNPKAMTAISRALHRQAIERLETVISNLDGQINALVSRKAK